LAVLRQTPRIENTRSYGSTGSCLPLNGSSNPNLKRETWNPNPQGPSNGHSRIWTCRSIPNSSQIPRPEDVLLRAEQSLAKVDVLLAEADKHAQNGFAPPEVFSVERWRASLSPSVPVGA
jgi:hypothetical protein